MEKSKDWVTEEVLPSIRGTFQRKLFECFADRAQLGMNDVITQNGYIYLATTEIYEKIFS